MGESFHIAIVIVMTNTQREKKILRIWGYIPLAPTVAVVSVAYIDNQYINKHQQSEGTKKKKIGTTHRIRFESVDDKRPDAVWDCLKFQLVRESINLLGMQSTISFGVV